MQARRPGLWYLVAIRPLAEHLRRATDDGQSVSKAGGLEVLCGEKPHTLKTKGEIFIHGAGHQPASAEIGGVSHEEHSPVSGPKKRKMALRVAGSVQSLDPT